MTVLQKQFDDFKRQMEVSSGRLQDEMEKQKLLHKEQIEHFQNQSIQISNELNKKNQLLEQIHSYLSDNNLYPENLKSKGIEVLLSSIVPEPFDRGLPVSLIEIDNEGEDDEQPQATKEKKKTGRPTRSISSENLKKVNVKQPKALVKRLDNK